MQQKIFYLYKLIFLFLERMSRKDYSFKNKPEQINRLKRIKVCKFCGHNWKYVNLDFTLLIHFLSGNCSDYPKQLRHL